jgi:asparagine synthase (glutamine-hydrolysing)
MCGFAGIFREGVAATSLVAEVQAMSNALVRRGPDDSGSWEDSEAGIALGHRRLSILDLSPAGHQPMASNSGRYVIAFNGEIYNHVEIRSELQSLGAAPPWRGHSDTETLLAAFELWGVTATLQRCNGMFAFAVWDRRESTLQLARDRFGEKPLYYGWCGGAFVFGSELKALRAFPRFQNAISRDALAEYFHFAYIPAPKTIYKGIYKLEPGCTLLVAGRPPMVAPNEPLSAARMYESVSLQRWWSLATTIENARKAPILDEAEALTDLESLLLDAVKRQSVADVPLGAFLSGGVDSSLIVALMQEQSVRPINTFTIGFDDAGFDESPHARAVARHLGTAHEEIFVSAEEARQVIPDLPDMYDEPFADSSQIPTHLVCRAARRHVTVALSGDAGDELFGGYNRYVWGPRLWRSVSWMPHWMRNGLSSGLRAATPSALDRVFDHAGVMRAGEKLHKLGHALRGTRSVDDLYRNLVMQWEDITALVRGEQEASRALPGLPYEAAEDARERMMFWDTLTYLPDDILCKVDRAAMAVSLETRVPFLDHRIAELAWRMPVAMKVRRGESKWVLRQLLYRRVPRELIERPKAGFALPIGEWLRGPLRHWAEDLLDEQRLEREGFLNPAPVREAWHQHVSGRYDWTSRLWTVLMFQAWLEKNS